MTDTRFDPRGLFAMLRDPWIVGAAATVTVLQLLYAFFADPFFNGDGYVGLGEDFLNYWRIGEFGYIIRTPGYPLILSAIYGLGLGDAGVKLVQIAMMTGGLLAVASIAELTVGRRAARASAWIFVTYLPLWAFSSIAMTEAISIPLLVFATVTLLLSEKDEARRKQWIAATATLGAIVTIVHPNLLPEVCLLVLILAYGSLRREGLRGAARTAVVSILPFLILFGPWVGRNLAIEGSPEPLGKNPFPIALGLHMPYETEIGEFASYRRSTRFFWRERSDGFTPEAALAMDPVAELRANLTSRTGEFLRSRAVAVAQMWPWPQTPRVQVEEPSVIPYPALMAIHLLVLGAGLVGLLRMRRTPAGFFGLGIVLIMFSMHLLFVALPRYTLPVFPYLIFGAGVVVSQLRWGSHPENEAVQAPR